jgi:hypothetical protein
VLSLLLAPAPLIVTDSENFFIRWHAERIDYLVCGGARTTDRRMGC